MVCSILWDRATVDLAVLLPQVFCILRPTALHPSCTCMDSCLLPTTATQGPAAFAFTITGGTLGIERNLLLEAPNLLQF